MGAGIEFAALRTFQSPLGTILKTKTLKYIIVQIGIGRERAIVFDEKIPHSMCFDEKKRIVSAGFCSLKFDERFENGLIVEVWGESTSLGIKSRELDKNLIYQSLIPGAYDYTEFLDPDDPMVQEIKELIDGKSY